VRRWKIVAAAVLLLLLTACSLLPEEEPVEQMKWYYLAEENASYRTQSGALCWEAREQVPDTEEIGAMVTRYLEGPETASARSPFPQQLELLDCRLEDHTLILSVTDHWTELSALDRRLAEACLVQTLTGIPAVEQVCLQTQTDVRQNASPVCLVPDDYLLYDDTATNDHVAVRLYFSDANGRYLVEELHSRAGEEIDSLPEYIVNELLRGPEDEGLLPTMPEGTNLLWVNLDQGICTVNLSDSFSTNRPATYAQARLAVFSLVNSLTELSQVESVRILCVGRALTDYAGLNLSQPLRREETAIWDDQSGTAVLDVTLYVPCGDSRLASIPSQIRQRSGRMGADAVLNTLLSFKSANGYRNPFPDGTALVGQNTRDGVCTVTFNSAFVLRRTSEAQMETAIRAVVASLCSMEQINQVIIEIFDLEVTDELLDTPLSPERDWFLP